MSEVSKNLISNINPRSPFAEAYRTLRTNINFAGLDKPYRTILITSAGPDEGKTTVTSNLGIVMAQANNKVLIIGCDLRRPTLHKNFDLNDTAGVTNVLVNDLDPADLAQETKVPGLYVLTSGPIPPNPAELVGSNRMKTLISRAGEKFDYVLVDSPPVNMVADSIILSTLVDGVIVVIRSASTHIEHAKETREKLEKVGARIIGVVLNKVDMAAGDYYYYLGSGK